MLRRIILSGVVVLAMGSYSHAETIHMVCHNSKSEYTLTFDPDKKTLVLDQGDIHLAYVITRLQSDEDGVLMAGRTSQYGTQFVASFQKDKWMRTFYGNGSSLVDQCE
jgi:hypothetical protein